MKANLKLVTLSIALLVVVSACSAPKSAPSTTDNKGVMTHNQNVTIYQTTRLSTVDISKVSSFGMLSSSTEGLFRLGKNGHVNMGLAESYKVSKSGRQYVFKIRPTARWSNGEQITAQDFVYSWRRTVKPSTKSVNAGLFDGMTNAEKIRDGKAPVSQLGVKALAKKTLQVTLDHPIYYFTRLLAYPLFAPQHQGMVDTYGREYGQNAAHQLYSGPFKLVKWHSNSNSRTLVPNPYYWDRDHVYLHSLTFTCSKSQKNSLKQYQAGKIDEFQLLGNQIPRNKNRTDYVVRPFALMRFLSYNFNTPDGSARRLINNEHARLAITHAIDRTHLIDDALKNASLSPRGFVPAGLSKNVLTNSDFSDQNKYPELVKADHKKAVSEWQLAKQELGQEHPSLTISLPNDPESQAVAKNLQQQLEKNLSGLTVKTTSYRSENNANQAQKGKYQLLLTGWGADYPDPLAFLQLMTSQSKYNFGHWHNSHYDALVNDITEYETDNPETRWNQMLAAEELLLTDQPVVPLYQQANSYLTNPRLNGVVYNVSGVSTDYKSAYLVK